MNTKAIIREALRLRVRYQTDDPYEVCDAMKIKVSVKPMGRNSRACKGFFMDNARCKIIVVNSHLPDKTQKIIVTHELGHAVLHAPQKRARMFYEMSVLECKNQRERDANIFAADFLIRTEELLDSMKEEPDFFALSSQIGVPPELLEFKFQLLKEEGYDLSAPIVATGDFLKRDIDRPYRG